MAVGMAVGNNNGKSQVIAPSNMGPGAIIGVTY